MSTCSTSEQKNLQGTVPLYFLQIIWSRKQSDVLEFKSQGDQSIYILLFIWNVPLNLIYFPSWPFLSVNSTSFSLDLILTILHVVSFSASWHLNGPLLKSTLSTDWNVHEHTSTLIPFSPHVTITSSHLPHFPASEAICNCKLHDNCWQNCCLNCCQNWSASLELWGSSLHLCATHIKCFSP